jgi:hypothetical protein
MHASWIGGGGVGTGAESNEAGSLRWEVRPHGWWPRRPWRPRIHGWRMGGRWKPPDGTVWGIERSWMLILAVCLFACLFVCLLTVRIARGAPSSTRSAPSRWRSAPSRSWEALPPDRVCVGRQGRHRSLRRVLAPPGCCVGDAAATRICRPSAASLRALQLASFASRDAHPCPARPKAPLRCVSSAKRQKVPAARKRKGSSRPLTAVATAVAMTGVRHHDPEPTRQNCNPPKLDATTPEDAKLLRSAGLLQYC